MKKIFSRFPEIPSWKLWLFVHLTIPALLGISLFFAGPVRINTMLQDMLPRSTQSKAAAQADALLAEKNSREAIIVASAPLFEDAKKGAVLLAGAFENSPKVEHISLYFDSGVLAEFTKYLNTYRFVITDRKTRELLETGNADEIADDALAAAYGAFSMTPLDTLEQDPFLLAHRRMETLLESSVLSGGKLSPKEDVLAAYLDNTWHVLTRITLAPGAVSLNSDKNIVKEIYAAAADARNAIPELRFSFSGVPFHSYESSSGAQKEIAVISTVSLGIILLLFLSIFRSPLPVLLSVTAAGVSLGMAAAAALLIFREMHILTFVFGTSLIGTCVDYSIHFFTHWKGNTTLKTGKAVRSHISKSIIMSFISTEICFVVFLLAPFPVLKQFSVFSMTGLLSSFLTSWCLYPYLPMPPEANRRLGFFQVSLPRRIGSIFARPLPRFILVAVLAVCCIAVLVFAPGGMRIHNDIRSLYTMSDTMMEAEKLTARVMDRGASFWYFIVSGSDPEETLRHEETLRARLDAEAARGRLGSYLATSMFVPSVETQRTTYESMRALLPLVPDQYAKLGFPPEYAEQFYQEFAGGIPYCLPENAPAVTGVANLWIGEAGGRYYSCVMPVQAADEALFRSIADEFDFVFFINKAQDISRDLDTLTSAMIRFFIAAYIIISVLVFRVYPWRDSLKICAIPLFLTLGALAALAVNNIPLGFFSATGLILVFGLGLDYIFYMAGNRNEETASGQKLTSLAVLLSFLTTLLSFGVLVLSGFTPVHLFGLTVAAGLGAAFIAAMLLGRYEL